jgi:hypothetical protein
LNAYLKFNFQVIESYRIVAPDNGRKNYRLEGFRCSVLPVGAYDTTDEFQRYLEDKMLDSSQVDNIDAEALLKELGKVKDHLYVL